MKMKTRRTRWSSESIYRSIVTACSTDRDNEACFKSMTKAKKINSIIVHCSLCILTSTLSTLNCMYLYSFSASRFESSILTVSSLPRGTKAGDLLIDESRYYLCLGEAIARPELYGHTSITLRDPSFVCQLMQTSTLDLLHRLVNEYYASYTAAIPLRLGNDIAQIVTKKKTIWPKRESTSEKNILPPQHLSIFPSLRAAETAYPQLSDDTIILSGQSTTVQRAKAYRGIKNGTITHVIATHSQIFRDRQHLTAIDIYDPLSWAYETYADPRYRLSDILTHMASIYSIHITTHGLTPQRPWISDNTSEKAKNPSSVR